MTVKILGKLDIDEDNEVILLPLFNHTVRAGFLSPACDYVQERIDLNSILIRHPNATFLVEVCGESMINMGIFPKDILVVDKSLNPCHKDIVIAMTDDGFTTKQLILDKQIILRSHNDDFADILVKGELEIFGVVTSSVRRFK